MGRGSAVLALSRSTSLSNASCMLRISSVKWSSATSPGTIICGSLLWVRLVLGLVVGGFCRGLGEAASGRGPGFSGWKLSGSKLIPSLSNSDLVIGAYVGCFALALEYVFIMSDSGGRIGQSFWM
jgi:hypothetical protein